jgi:hypothetical protein
VTQAKALNSLLNADQTPIDLFRERFPKPSKMAISAIYNSRIDQGKKHNMLHYPPVEKNSYKMQIPSSEIIQDKLIAKVSPH